jgi:AmpD protein
MKHHFLVGEDGWCADVRRMPSPNFDDRPAGARAELLVIHNISLPAGRFGGSYIEDLFSNRLDVNAHPSFCDLAGLRVSAHFLVRRGGEVIQFVSVHDRAWHAGVSRFEARERCNDFSIGIEMEGSDSEPFEEAQYVALARLTLALQSACPLRHVAGHEDIAPGRKTDPGPFFDWLHYRDMLLPAADASAHRAETASNLAFPFLEAKIATQRNKNR